MLDLALLERIQELRNQFKEPYVPSDLSKKEDLQEKDFLFTDSDERNKLLKDSFVHSSFISCFIRCITLF